VRVPFHKPTKTTSSRVEFRGLDSSANPYLAFAVLLAAGMAGVEGAYELPEGAEDAVWDLTERERRAMGIEPLPTDLFRALEVFESSELMADTLGEQVFEFFLRDKQQEWQRYREQVTDHELRSTFSRV
jgi:glutamine synthetase